MKRTLFLICTALLLSAPAAWSQVSVRAGINLASVSSEPGISQEDLEEKSIVGFQAGIGFDLGVTDIFTIQPELIVIQKGGKRTYSVRGNEFYEDEFRQTFLEIPVMAKIKFSTDENGEGMGFYLLGGPFAGLALNGKYKGETDILGIKDTFERDIEYSDETSEDYQKRLDWGVSFGGGLQFGSLFLDARYNLGLNNLLDEDASNNNDNKPYLRTRGIGVTLGYEF
jgi:hypothetical protein